MQLQDGRDHNQRQVQDEADCEEAQEAEPVQAEGELEDALEVERIGGPARGRRAGRTEMLLRRVGRRRRKRARQLVHRRSLLVG